MTLLPCPFCGAAAVFKERKTFWVECSNPDCGALMLRTAKPAAIDGWNRRVTYREMLDGLNAEREKVVRAIEALERVIEMSTDVRA